MTSAPVYLLTGLPMCAADPRVHEWRDTGEGRRDTELRSMCSAPCVE